MQPGGFEPRPPPPLHAHAGKRGITCSLRERRNTNQGKWCRLDTGASLVLPRFGELRRSPGEGRTLSFTPNAEFAAGQGSMQFRFEKTTAANLLSRSSFVVLVDKQPQQQSYQLQLSEPGDNAFETLPIGFSQAINRERITRAMPSPAWCPAAAAAAASANWAAMGCSAIGPAGRWCGGSIRRQPCRRHRCRRRLLTIKSWLQMHSQRG